MIHKIKSEVCDFFINNQDSLSTRCKTLLDYCIDYETISAYEYYSYNKWV
jgi:hypothetical protein